MINADPSELRKFSDLAQHWWDPAGAMRPLHELNPVRLSWIDALAGLAGKQVVDVGCGGGILSEAMARANASVTGIDLSDEALAVARAHALESRLAIDYRCIGAEAMAVESPASFDVVTCMELLEHVPAPDQTVRACAALAKPSGWIFFSTINRNAKSFSLAVVGAEYVLRLLPKGTHDYSKFIRPSELARFTRDVGLEIVALPGFTYNPLTRGVSLGTDTDVNYAMACRKSA